MPVLGGVVVLGEAALRARRGNDQGAGAVLGRDERQRRLPGVAADQRRHGGVGADRERAQRLPGREVLAFLEDRVRRQMQLAVNVDEAVALVVHGAVVGVRAALGVLGEPDVEAHGGGAAGELHDARVVDRDRDVLLDRADGVSRQEQLGEHDEVAAVALGPIDGLGRLVHIGVDIAQHRVELRERDPHAQMVIVRGPQRKYMDQSLSTRVIGRRGRGIRAGRRRGRRDPRVPCRRAAGDRRRRDRRRRGPARVPARPCARGRRRGRRPRPVPR